MEDSENFKIVAFLCNWCTYAAADLAGTGRLIYPPNVRTVRIMCSGSLDPMYVVKAFLEGADGVLVGGCALGDCHYTSGNYKARRKVAVLREVLDAVGIEKDRLWLRWISASESGLFSETIQQMTKAIKAMGPTLVQGRMIL
ncbi:MAG: hydrogenase iron-sulfur subunit [Deltaproteobacteria bacterium]|nr:hydrogenase iron-sulfur subunit [Deltaproteobacteria bacterium]